MKRCDQSENAEGGGGGGGGGGGTTNHSNSLWLVSTSDSSSKHNHTGDTSLHSLHQNPTRRQSIIYDQHYCGFCSKPFKYFGPYNDHMKDHSHLRLLKDPFGPRYICRFCSCSSFEDVDTVVRHLWDNHSLDIENLVFHECCAHCYLQNSIFNVQGAANAAFDAEQAAGGEQDGGGQENHQ